MAAAAEFGRRASSLQHDDADRHRCAGDLPAKKSSASCSCHRRCRRHSRKEEEEEAAAATSSPSLRSPTHLLDTLLLPPQVKFHWRRHINDPMVRVGGRFLAFQAFGDLGAFPFSFRFVFVTLLHNLQICHLFSLFCRMPCSLPVMPVGCRMPDAFTVHCSLFTVYVSCPCCLPKQLLRTSTLLARVVLTETITW